MSEALEVLLKKRKSIKGTITRIQTFLEKNKDQNIDQEEYSIREEMLSEAFKSYSCVQDQIEILDDSKAEDRGETETKYCSLISALKKKSQISSFTVNSSMPGSISSSVNLPKLNIPSFTGDISDWKAFHDLFKALIIDNKQISDVEKFVYLKSALKNEPLNLINNLKLTNDNFKTAITILEERYGNKHLIINNHIRKLLDTPQITKCNANNLREFLTHVKQHLHSLENLNVPIASWDLLLIFIFAQKLDFHTRQAFELDKNSTTLPTLTEFYNFLEKRCTALENLAPPDIRNEYKKVSHFSSSSSDSRYNTKPLPYNTKCVYCNISNHGIYKCSKFKNLTLPKKREFVQKHKLCFNCLGTKHSVENCTSQKVCAICQKKHHSSLHSDFIQQKVNVPAQYNNSDNNRASNSSTSSQPSDYSESLSSKNMSQYKNSEYRSYEPRNERNFTPENSEATVANSACSAQNKSTSQQILLATVKLTLISAYGKPIEAKALLDCGSQTSFISRELCKKLNYCPYSRNLQISGISDSSVSANQMIDIVLNSKIENKQFKTSCAVLNKITSSLPQSLIDISQLKIPDNVELADPTFYYPSKIDLLLGSDVYYELIVPEIKTLGDNTPILQNTHLGWVIGGPISRNDSNCFLNSNISLFSKISDLNEFIPKFWRVEEIPHKHFLSPDDKIADKIFSETTKVLDNGSFQVNLPLKTENEHLKLGDSFTQARKRFYLLEKRFQRNKELFSKYKEFIDEYVSLNHAKYVPLELQNHNLENKYFFPHLCVLRENSTTTKLRVVFDGSMKTSTGYSLNDVMLKGYTVQPNLFDIICRFRLPKYVLIADIKKMYRQISVNPSQRFLLNILWRNKPEEQLKCIELSTVTYGTNCAPFLATRCLVELAKSKINEFPLASEAILSQCYVDDIISGAENVDNLVELRNQLTNLLNSAGFTLHKWCSNSKIFSDIFCENEIFANYNIKSDNTSNKVLGLSWNPNTDVFNIYLPPSSYDTLLTKRNVLSSIAQLYDPLGYIGPVVIVAKIFMQTIWLNKLEWDDVLNNELAAEWTNFVSNIHHLEALKIPRYLFTSQNIVKVQILGFSDASIRAYGACVYLRTLYGDNQVSCNLICSKSRVTPIKQISLPRLELCAVVLLSKLTEKVLSVFESKLKIETVNLWTDSQIVLCWLKSTPARWTTFVANRVAEVQEITAKYHWRHIKSADNPADLISRGMTPLEINNSTLWWHGPRFLQNYNLDLNDVDLKSKVQNIPEQRKITLSNIINENDNIFSKFSCYTRLHRTLAYCLRFLHNSKPNSSKIVTSLTIDELQTSHNLIIVILQSKTFSLEISQLKNNKNISKHDIASLNPFLDSQGILRIGGRLSNADIPFEQKHPILLPSKNHITLLLLRKEHLKLYHAGAQTVLSNFRLRYWPLNGLREIKRIIKSCVICHRFKAHNSQQIMANLPKDRISRTRPFSVVGVDFGGPLSIKSSRLRRASILKCYFSVFVCMVTKSVHIEAVSSLSTEAFLLTLKRFISRRGNPSTIYSDNATNFIGAHNKLRELHIFFKNKQNLEKIENFLSHNETRWKFIPPRSPHWGGIWEAAIKSTKHHINRVVGNSQLTFEELSTVLAQIEAILNSRPLCPLSNDPSDFNCLTPGHFLIGDSLTAYPEKDITLIPCNRISFWQNCIKLQQQFWKKWSVEYLNRLQNRPKWFRPIENLSVNDLVLLREDNIPPLKWPLARIFEIMPSSDGKVRVVKLRTNDGIFTRSISKLCPLPKEA